MSSNKLLETVKTLGDKLEIEIWSEDLQHAIDGHPDTTLEKIRETLKDPTKVIQSKSSNNACLFYSITVKISDTEILYFCVVVAVIGNGKGKLVTAYDSDYMKNGNELYSKGK